MKTQAAEGTINTGGTPEEFERSVRCHLPPEIAEAYLTIETPTKLLESVRNQHDCEDEINAAAFLDTLLRDFPMWAWRVPPATREGAERIWNSVRERYLSSDFFELLGSCRAADHIRECGLGNT